jgi:hypothetical protein
MALRDNLNLSPESAAAEIDRRRKCASAFLKRDHAARDKAFKTEGAQPLGRDKNEVLEGEGSASLEFGNLHSTKSAAVTLSPRSKLRRAVHKLVLISRFNRLSRTKIDSKLDFRDAVSSIRVTRPAGGAVGDDRRDKASHALIMDQHIRESSDYYSYAFRRQLLSDDEVLPWYLIRPDTAPRIAWDVLALLIVVYFSITVPIALSFEVPSTRAGAAFDHFSNVFFIIDIVLSFITTFKVDGVWVDDAKVVRREYMSFWFPIDVISSFPIDWVMMLSSDDGGTSTSSINKIVRLMRLYKMFRLLRLARLFPRVMVHFETSVKVNPAIFKLGKTLVILVMTWHLIGCAYWFVVRSEYGGTRECDALVGRPPRTCFVNHCLCDVDLTRDESRITVLNDMDVSWYDPFNPDIWVPHPMHANSGTFEQYTIAFFFSVEITTSVGNNVSPRSVTEYIFTIVAIVVSLIMYSSIISTVSAYVSNEGGEVAQKRVMREKVVAYLESRRVPFFFQKVILDYFAHRWDTPGTVGVSGKSAEQELLGDLPPAIRSHLSMIVNRDIIARLPIFHLMPIAVYLRQMKRLKTTVFLPSEFIIRQGDVGDSIFFVTRGKVDAVLPNGITVFATHKPGDIFGEHSLLWLSKRDASYRAVNFVDTFEMTRPDFTELYITAPDFIREVQRIDATREKTRLAFEAGTTRGASSPAASPAAPSAQTLDPSGGSGAETAKRGPASSAKVAPLQMMKSSSADDDDTVLSTVRGMRLDAHGASGNGAAIRPNAGVGLDARTVTPSIHSIEPAEPNRLGSNFLSRVSSVESARFNAQASSREMSRSNSLSKFPVPRSVSMPETSVLVAAPTVGASHETTHPRLSLLAEMAARPTIDIGSWHPSSPASNLRPLLRQQSQQFDMAALVAEEELALDEEELAAALLVDDFDSGFGGDDTAANRSAERSHVESSPRHLPAFLQAQRDDRDHGEQPWPNADSSRSSNTFDGASNESIVHKILIPPAPRMFSLRSTPSFPAEARGQGSAVATRAARLLTMPSTGEGNESMRRIGTDFSSENEFVARFQQLRE